MESWGRIRVIEYLVTLITSQLTLRLHTSLLLNNKAEGRAFLFALYLCLGKEAIKTGLWTIELKFKFRSAAIVGCDMLRAYRVHV